MEVSLTNVGINCKHLNLKRLSGIILVFCFSLLCMVGIGYCMTAILMMFPRCVKKQVGILCTVAFIDSTIPYLIYSGRGKGTKSNPILSDVTNRSTSVSIFTTMKRQFSKLWSVNRQFPDALIT